MFTIYNKHHILLTPGRHTPSTHENASKAPLIGILILCIYVRRRFFRVITLLLLGLLFVKVSKSKVKGPNSSKFSLCHSLKYLFWAAKRDTFRRDLNALQVVPTKSSSLSVLKYLFQSQDDLYTKLCVGLGGLRRFSLISDLAKSV